MRFYIATALERAKEAEALSAELVELGHSPTYSWWVHGSVQDKGDDVISATAMAEAQGVIDADMFIGLLPGGRGTHSEFGLALADSILRQQGGRSIDSKAKLKRIILVGPLAGADKRVCAFYLHPTVDNYFNTPGEVVAFMEGLQAAARGEWS